MHNSRKLPLRGLLYHHRKITFRRAVDVCEKKMPLGRTYMHNTRKLPLKGLQQETMPLGRAYMYDFGNCL